ncbi:MAG: hypothetical protein ABGX16_19385, partial [Pirellulales bacterium]
MNNTKKETLMPQAPVKMRLALGILPIRTGPMPANEQHKEGNLNAAGSGQDAFGVGNLANPHWTY